MRIRHALGAAALLAAVPAHAATFIPVVPVPNSTFTLVYGINDDNVIVGGYYDAGGLEHGFYGTLAGDYTTFDVKPGVYPGSEARGINKAGDIVGNVNFVQGDASKYYQFERLAATGKTKLVTQDGTLLGGLMGEIDNKRVFTGEYFSDGFRGYLGKSFKYASEVNVDTTFDRVRPRGLNDHGDIVGYTGLGPTNTGFWLHNGATNVIAYPDPSQTNTFLEGINDKGLITGYWSDTGHNNFGFSLDTSTSTYTPIIAPGAANSTTAFGANSAGLIAVQAITGDGPVSYIYCPKAKRKCPAAGPAAHAPHVQASRLPAWPRP